MPEPTDTTPDTTTDPAPEHIRVLDLDTGHKLTIHAVSLPHGRYRVLAEDAYDHTGQVLPPEHNAEAPQPAEATPVDDNVGGDSAYAGTEWTLPKLKAEVAARNEGRGEDDVIEVEAPGNKSDLIAALVADDAS